MKRQKRGERVRDADRTVALLKEATISQLMSNGFAGLSIKPILDKAGVSSGALFHHFPTKDHLIAAAFEDLLIDAARTLHQIGADLRAGRTSLDEFIVRTSDFISSDLFIGCMEIALGLRAEPALAELVETTVNNWRQSLFEFWNETFELPGYDGEACATHWAMASNTLRGHAFALSFGAAQTAKKHLYRGFRELYLKTAVVRPENSVVVAMAPRAKRSRGGKS